MKISDNSPKCQCIGFILFSLNTYIWGIWVHSVVSGTNIKHSTDCRGTSKNSIPFSWGTHFCLDFASLYP